jgi:hypothetical protein
MKNQINTSANLSQSYGIKNMILMMVIGMICVPVFGQMSDVKTEKKPVVNSVRTGTGEVISVHNFQLKQQINKEDFEKWVIGYWNPAMVGVFPGVKSFITMGDTRGDATGKYAYVLIFDSLKTRDAFLPEEGKHSEWFKEIYFSPNKHLYEELFEYVEGDAFTNYSAWVVMR